MDVRTDKGKTLITISEDLIHAEQVHGSLYTDSELFSEELKRIWNRTWVCVGHESEVPEPNDYVRKSIGPQDVIMTRDRDGEIRLLLNRCSHRANMVCEDQRGNSSSFRCPYHGWTFRNTGELLGYPFREGYTWEKGDPALNLGTVRVAIHRGFVFGNLSSDGPSLLEFLGPVADELDRLANLSPVGELDFSAGWLKHRAHANWKLLYENDIDGYHPMFVHESILKVSDSHVGGLYSDKSQVVTRDLGNGHSDKDMKPEYHRSGQPLQWVGATPEKVPEYINAMREAYGDRADQLLIEGPPTLGVFPNIFIGEIHFTIFQPVSVDVTIQHVTPLLLKGAPDLNKRILRQTVASVGPAGMFLADDMEMHERVQRGLHALRPEWVQIGRGLHRERVDGKGYTVGQVTDETGMRAFWRQYMNLMTGSE